MTIKIGDSMPEGQLMAMAQSGPERLATRELFEGRRVALVSVPGAFTPTCSVKHLPGYIDRADALKARGIDEIVCMAVNDIYVMAAWATSLNCGDKVTLLADGNGDYVRALGLELDDRQFGMGMRGQRFSMLIENGVVKQLNVEPPGEFGVSSAETMLQQLC